MTFGVLYEWELWTFENCAPYERNVLTPFLAFTRGTSLLITISLYAYGLARREIYSLYFGVVLTIDAWLINAPLQHLLRDPVPIDTCTGIPSLLGSGARYGMPSTEVQHTTLFVTFILLYCFIWRTRQMRAWHVAVLLLYQAVLVFSFVFFQYNSARQIVAGAALGAVNALAGQLIFFFFIFPYLRCIVGWKVIEWGGYQDTMCLPANENSPAVT